MATRRSGSKKNNAVLNVERYCLSKPGTELAFPFGPQTAVFRVGGKMFALTTPPRNPDRINLKCVPMLAVHLREQYPAVLPGYHMNKTHWNTVLLDGSIDEDEVKKMVDLSYDLVKVSSSRPKKRP
ncbi:MAG: MmcQ/YjbR family DNA-binding protein [Dehalococcoidia bacterium]|nr:MmcQ/YjbR family DNA-binding protein [Dehalococcoidia bacterium]